MLHALGKCVYAGHHCEWKKSAFFQCLEIDAAASGTKKCPLVGVIIFDFFRINKIPCLYF